MSGMDSSRGWSPFERLLIERMDKLEADIGSVDEKITLVRIDVATLKVKAGIWGAAAGMVPALIGLAMVSVQGGVG